MENRKEIKPFLEYTNDEGKQFFYEGDTVICFTESERYSGTIIAIRNYKEREDSDSQFSVYLDTSKNSKNRSCKIINIADITYMCKVSVNDWLGYPKTNEDLDRKNFVDMIAGLGYTKEKAEIMYNFMKKFIALYNIPLSVALSCIIKEVGVSTEEKNAEELKDISSKLINVMATVFQSITDVVKKTRVPNVES